jgi:hypothetical protein
MEEDKTDEINITNEGEGKGDDSASDGNAAHRRCSSHQTRRYNRYEGFLNCIDMIYFIGIRRVEKGIKVYKNLLLRELNILFH